MPAPFMTPTMPDALHDAILAWYDTRGRSLPFRGTKDPYAILVSEVMAQQTQISRVAERWTSFIATFPTIELLAAATPADVLRAWHGLGYNRRALSLRQMARIVVDEHGGVLPNDVETLQRLPGIGPYTARAVAAIAFGTRVGPVDTNVRRVLGRAVGGAVDALPAAALQRLADASVPFDRAADWTHALMDVGATFCRAARPACAECPARAWCRFAAGHRPPRASKPASRRTSRRFSATSRWLRGRILDALREADGAGWVVLRAPIGEHDEGGVIGCLEVLSADGLVERQAGSVLTARLPLA